MVWSVTPSLHTPLMSVTNAISSVIIVGAIIAALSGGEGVVFSSSSIYGFLAIILAVINIFGGFLVAKHWLCIKKPANTQINNSCANLSLINYI